MVMGLKQAGWEFPHPQGVQPEDHLTAFLRGDAGVEALRRLAPWAVDKATGDLLFPPNEVHAVLTWGVNELMGQEVSSFRTDWDVDGIIASVTEGCGVVLSGRFPLAGGGELRHMVSLSGYRIKSVRDGSQVGMPPRFNQLDQLYIDDPYGDWNTNYNDHHGNNSPMTPEQFMQIMNTSGSRQKWAHIIRPAV